MAVRNSSVARGILTATGATYVYTVPAGFVLLLKNIVMAQSSGTAFGYFLNLVASDGSANVYFARGTVAANQNLYWSGWSALNAGDSLGLGVDTASVGYWVSGALLPFNAAL